MGQINTREIVLLNGTFTTSGVGPDINAIQGWQSAIVCLNCTSASGTLPTLNVYIQKKLGQAAATDQPGQVLTGTPIYDDLLHFTQVTTTITRLSQLTTLAMPSSANSTLGSSSDWANAVNTIPAGDQRVGPIGGIWALSYVIGGTTPSFTFSVTVQLIPFAT